MTPNFHNLVDSVVAARGLSELRAVVEKEILHYDILYCLQKRDFLRNITFQGGTSLRLVYGSRRFSEDLDFAGGHDFCQDQGKGMAEAISDHIGSRYGLPVHVKEPAGTGRGGISVDKWQVSVVTHPGDRSLPRQRIKVEVGSVPAYTRETRPLTANYDGLPAGYGGMMIGVESMEEILADKLVSLPAVTSHVRHRDIWDMLYIKQRQPEFRADLISAKIADYGVEDYGDKVGAMMEALPGIVEGREFQDEMRRFLDPAGRKKFLENPDFRRFLVSEIGDMLDRARRETSPEATGMDFMI